jgi:hypothetical protein
MPDPRSGFARWFQSRLPFFWHNWICSLGSILVIISTSLLLMFLLLFAFNAMAGRHNSPYLDLVAFMVLPAVLVGGALILLVGNLVHRLRIKSGHPPREATILGGDLLVKRMAMVAVVCLVVLVGLGGFSYEAFHYTESNEFCATVCHQVMEPEATSYERSPHSRVKCVACHIGPGAEWFVQAKISGIRQVWAVMTDSYHRPIASPVENLRPARETCEVCHQPDKFHGARILVRKHFEPDEENTETVTANLMHIGGPEQEGMPARGIHWHVDPRNEVRYRHTDRQRQNIVEVVQKTADGEIRYLKNGAEAESGGEWRTMDCLDCHNRPTHQYELPDQALDAAFAAGLLDSDIPWLRKEAQQVLMHTTPGENTQQEITDRLVQIYRDAHPDALAALEAGLQPTAAQLAEILERNVFPYMKIEWGTYSSNLSHFDGEDELGTSGCFRCHTDEHETEDGHYIAQDCDICHEVLAYREEGWEGLGGIDVEAFLVR